MKVHRLDNLHRGWCIGDFEPSILRTQEFEVAVLTHPKGEYWKPHYHKIATEYNILLSGSMTVCNTHLTAGDIFVIAPEEIAAPVFHEDCQIVCIKTPSVPSDKYFV